MNDSITISEYQDLYVGKTIKGKTFSQKQFDLLENFILANSEKDGDGARAMGLAIKNGKKIITARQYVGTITLADGTNIEILPKIYNSEAHKASTEEEKKQEIENVKKILMNMLRSLNNAPSKNLQNTDLEVSKLPLFEVFIRMFVDEVFAIVKKGLKGGYVTVNSNENYLKGKLLLNRHIRENYVHKEKFYIEYDEFNANQPENRLIKSTLLYLDKRTVSAKNKQLIKRLLAVFDDVPCSDNYTADFGKIIKERNNGSYDTALMWSKIFLTGNTFTTFAGEKYAKALLFDMNDLFECYIAKKVGQCLRKKQGYSLSVQDSRYYLFDKPKRFSLRPDMVITDNNFIDKKTEKKTTCTYILDTKWKILSETKNNGGISQSDMYQMYAYFKEYEAHNKNPQSVTLIYPYTDDPVCKKEPEDLVFSNNYNNGNKDVIIKIRFIDLTKIDVSIENLVNDVNNLS